MYEIELKNVADSLPSLLDLLNQNDEIVLTDAHRPIARITKLVAVPAKTVSDRGVKAAALLEELARRNTFSEIADPVEWQRETRQDRPLPGRD